MREFRVEVNAYGAEFGRNAGGQINVLTKSGTNRYAGSAYEYHRNDTFDARNYFDGAEKPAFTRNQFGGSLGGPLQPDRSFFLRQRRLARKSRSHRPHLRSGRQCPAGPPATERHQVPVSPLVVPYLNEYPRANGEALGDGSAIFTFPFEQT